MTVLANVAIRVSIYRCLLPFSEGVKGCSGVDAYSDAKCDYADPYHEDFTLYVVILTLIPAVLFNIHSFFMGPACSFIVFPRAVL